MSFAVDVLNYMICSVARNIAYFVLFHPFFLLMLSKVVLEN
uniref:Uncharacterized protein n=1 Tax=Arundo donax TaxID=35708 RepID=A0A0A9C448_ARUDO